jgi:hypothetical protein
MSTEPSLLLGLLDNVTLFFEVTDPASTGYDPETGEDDTQFITIPIRVYLEETTPPNRDEFRSQPGNSKASFYDGNCCEPSTLPRTIAFDSICPCEFDGDDGIKVKGTFQMVPTTQDAEMIALGLNDLQGQHIRGWFTPQTTA